MNNRIVYFAYFSPYIQKYVVLFKLKLTLAARPVLVLESSQQYFAVMST